MTRTCAAVLAASLLLGCRSSQQATNPFLRTTVPPPGTGEGAVVAPAQPYYPGAPPGAPPQGATVVGPPPVTTGPQPVVPPPRDLKKSVPGGSYIYHQSSVKPARHVEADEADLAGDVESGGKPALLAVNGTSPSALRLGGASDAVEQALALSKESAPGEDASFEDYGSRSPGDIDEQDDPASELAVLPPRPRARTAAHTGTHAPIRAPSPVSGSPETTSTADSEGT